MEFRTVGSTDVEVSSLSLGSWNVYSRLSFEAAVKLVARAAELGINFYDVAYYRDKPHTEVLWSRISRGAGLRREDYVLADKVWFFNYPQESLADQLDRMLVRLDTDYLDIVISEHPRPGMAVEELAEEVAGLVQSGSARHWGALNWSPADLSRAYEHNHAKGLPTPQLVQLKYSLVRRNVVEAADYKQTMENIGASFHASDTLEGGILAGNLNPTRKIGIDVGDIRDEIRAMVPRVKEAAATLGVTPVQFAMAFCLVNKQVASLLFGATRIAQLEDNAGAVALAQERPDAVLELARGMGIEKHAIDNPYPHSKALLDEFVA